MASLVRKLSMEGLGHCYEDAALFALRATTGLFLLYQSHDNLLSAARMEEFQGFMAQFGFWRPGILAPSPSSGRSPPAWASSSACSSARSA